VVAADSESAGVGDDRWVPLAGPTSQQASACEGGSACGLLAELGRCCWLGPKRGVGPRPGWVGRWRRGEREGENWAEGVGAGPERREGFLFVFVKQKI